MISGPLLISHRAMAEARTRGRAAPLSAAITEFVRYSGGWWTDSPDGWLRITDSRMADCLTGIRARLDHSEEEQRCLRSQVTDKEDTP